jgi:SAM-dependent methyltransferase
MSHREIFRTEGLPVLQNRMFPTAAKALASAMGDIVLVQDGCTGLIRNEAFDPSKLAYDQDYQNEQACSGVFKKHLEDVALVIKKHFFGKSLIEVGCGKGYFLEYLQTIGFNITGIDPAYEGENKNIVKAHFDNEIGISADGIILRHVLEHIPDPLSFLAKIASANRGKGVIYIEVPCFDWICEHRAWFDIFYEHVNYFRLEDFFRMFGRIYESGYIFGKQYIYIIADLTSLRTPVAEPNNRMEIPKNFLAGIEHTMSLIGKDYKRKNVIWGAASKGVIFSLYMQRAGCTIDKVIDINPGKQGRYLAGSGLIVSSPKEALSRLSLSDNLFIMNSNYLNEIVVQSGNKFSYFTVDHE